jgi:hypothetical protein
VGVGTTLGAGIFVTCAVIAVVSFVSDVRLARRSFVRDVLFFIATIVYLLAVSLDGYITLGESVGFIVIYLVFVAVRAGVLSCGVRASVRGALLDGWLPGRAPAHWLPRLLARPPHCLPACLLRRSWRGAGTSACCDPLRRRARAGTARACWG